MEVRRIPTVFEGAYHPARVVTVTRSTTVFAAAVPALLATATTAAAAAGAAAAAAADERAQIWLRLLRVLA